VGDTVYRDRHSALAALLLAESGFEVDPVVEGLFLHEPLECPDDVIGTPDVTGTADTNT
jgi:hypothetical protein